MTHADIQKNHEIQFFFKPEMLPTDFFATRTERMDGEEELRILGG